MAKRGRSLADLDADLGAALDTTGPQATDRPGTSTPELAEKLRQRLAARGALPPQLDSRPEAHAEHCKSTQYNVQRGAWGECTCREVSTAGVQRYGGDPLAPLVVSRRAGPKVSRGTSTEVRTGAQPLVGLTPETERHLGVADAIFDKRARQQAPRRPPAAAVDVDGERVVRGRPKVSPPAGAAADLCLGGNGTEHTDLHDTTSRGRTRPGTVLAPDGGSPVGGPGPLVLQPAARAETGVFPGRIYTELTPGAVPVPTEVPVWPGPYQFVTGPAGSGKTTLVRGWRVHDPGFLLCATTGIAAVNLGCDVVTVHSTLRFSTTDVLEDMFVQGFLQARLRKLRAAGITRYGIDEISMLGARALTILTNAIDEINSDAAVQMGHEPETGITLIGDFLQLPPVGDPDPRDDKRRRIVEYAFESEAWPKYEAHIRRLEGTHRHHDPDFIRALRAIRVGDPRSALDVLRDHIQPALDRGFPGVTILGKNAQVDRYNKLQQGLLPGEVVRYSNRMKGESLREWEKHIPVFSEFKRGARVMILANKYVGVGNDQTELLYANGDCGTFVDGNPDAKWADVRLDRTGAVVRANFNLRQNLVPTGAKGKKKDAFEVKGEIDYMPLRLAYATSVHKSQGLTLDQVQVELNDGFFTAPAMTYVALSRARSLEGLRIVGNPDMLLRRCTVDPKVERWR